MIIIMIRVIIPETTSEETYDDDIFKISHLSIRNC